ncbi:DNA-processing protein DprA [Streptomyces sp. RPT161]|uniref:DNA-processing protein DprA n=1 Tax=Streptomyces sp. RPT161 TaxID=3015993 RepID=UPI0022B8FAB4|nr:DNA-processing protein DprA [Streptomyces sp. RPT161]
MTTEPTPTDERRARAALSRIAEPGDPAIGRWLREHGPIETLRMLTTRHPLPGISDTRTAGYRLRAQHARPDNDLATIETLGGRFICPNDPDWPSQLNDLGDQRPVGLWAIGHPALRPWALRSIAIVGARASSDYGTHIAATLASDLAEAGWTVISGAAYGIDSAAHRGALAAHGATIAVVACGVDKPYPRGNTELLRRITQQGMIIAELPPGEHPTRSRFIQRNRVIAALARGTVVVEAQLRSGSLITARRATALGRITMGVPGPVTSALSAGVHQLLREEGQLVADATDIIELTGSIGDDLAPERRSPVHPRDLLAPATAAVLEGLPGHGDADTEHIARAAGTGMDEAAGRLHELHTLGFVERHGTRWRLTNAARESGTPRIR